MILVCPACSTKYATGSNALGEAGRKVKCAKCGHIWFQEPVEETAPAETGGDFAAARPETPETPAASGDVVMPDFDALLGVQPAQAVVSTGRSSSGGFRFWGILLLLAGIGALGWGFAPQFSRIPVLAPVYGFLGITPTEGVVLTGMTVETAKTRRNIRFLISGFIQNQAKEERAVPSILITTTDGKEPIGSPELLASNGATLKPGEKIPFFKELKRYSDTVAFVHIDLGNGYQLNHRQ